MNENIRRLEFPDREIILVGTAHVSKESINEVKTVIEDETPDSVAIELDDNRLESITNSDSWRNLDIIKVLRKHQGFLMLANLVLASFQKRMGEKVEVKPGDEMKAAFLKAKELKIPVIMADRPIQVTLRRAWGSNSFFGKMKLLAYLFANIFSTEEISEEEIENLKHSNEMDSMMNELANSLPKVKRVLIDERDFYLASKIWNTDAKKVVAVIGAGHGSGIQSHLEKMSKNQEGSDVSDISVVPPKKKGSVIAGWVIPVLIIALIVTGFYFGGKTQGRNMLGSWVIWNGALAAIGTLIAGGNPITIIVAFIGAPLTSLCPLIGVGILTGIVQAIICKPKISDMEFLQNDAGSLKGFYHNRILRVLLVFFFSSIGSSIGTFVAGASFIAQIGKIFTHFFQ